MTSSMSPRERWLAAMRLEPVDRLPFWPKLNGSYPKAQAEPFSGMDNRAIHDWIGSDPHEGVLSCVGRKRSKTSVNTTRDDGVTHTVYTTPYGELRSASTYDGPSDSWHPTEFPVKTLEDIKLLTAFEQDVVLDLDQEKLERARERTREIGDSAVTVNCIGESPLMNWIEHIAGVENAHYLLMDHQEEVEALFDAMHANLVRTSEILSEHSPVDLLYMIENTSTTLISPDQYAQYCAKHVGEYAAITKAAERNMVLHMCGHLKALLPQLAEIPAQAFEAFTSPTLGNTTLLDGRTNCPDKCLVGGTNAMLWLKPPAEIIARIKEDLDALPHHRGIVVTSAGVMPPLCKPDTIREVCDWVQQYPARMQAA